MWSARFITRCSDGDAVGAGQRDRAASRLERRAHGDARARAVAAGRAAGAGVRAAARARRRDGRAAVADRQPRHPRAADDLGLRIQIHRTGSRAAACVGQAGSGIDDESHKLWPGRPLAPGGDVGWDGDQLRAVFGECDRRRAVSVRLALRGSRSDAPAADRAHELRVARLRAAAPTRTALRLSRRRPVRSRGRTSLQPEEAAARSLRARDRPAREVGRCAVRVSDRIAGPQERRRQRRVGAARRGDRSRVLLG